jgi:carboxymethylenebutenolidase
MQRLKRILLGLFLLIVGLVLLLFGSIFVDGFFGQGRLDALTNLNIPAMDGATIRAYLAKPAGPGPHPAVILIHEFYGLRPDILSKADALAKEGYVVIAPNVFRSGTTNWIPRAIYNIIRADTQQIDSDVGAAYQWLAAQSAVQPNRIAIMGFCFGGGTALRYSLSNNHLAATAVFYGQPISDPVKLKALSGPFLGIFGGADGSISQASVEALRQGLQTAGVPNEITVYAGQPHAFVRGMDEIAKGGPPQAAWQQLLAFLKKNLQEGAGAVPTHSLTLAEAERGESSLLYALRLALSHLVHM